VGGQAKVAPENMADHVLKLMRKPGFHTFERFLDVFERESAKAGKRQYVIPYLMSAFPGCTDDDMRALGDWLRQRGWKPEQVQCFIPLPGTAAAAMFHAGTDLAGNPIPVARTDAERLRQHGLLMPTTGRPGTGGKQGGKHGTRHGGKPGDRPDRKTATKPGSAAKSRRGKKSGRR
jgi:radical SAM superfamily enzyme YgiQ (UPF0313 family)